MKFSLTLVFVGFVSASAAQMAGQSVALLARRDLGGLMRRATCPHEGNTCETACGPEFHKCVYDDMCYNPGRGDSCCSNGYYCEPGYYCTNAGCCPDGNSLEQCHATATISTLPPSAATKQPRESTSRPQASTAPATVTTPLPSVVTAGAEKNTEAGALAAIGGIAALLLAM